jgi:hypothetical protein
MLDVFQLRFGLGLRIARFDIPAAGAADAGVGLDVLIHSGLCFLVMRDRSASLGVADTARVTVRANATTRRQNVTDDLPAVDLAGRGNPARIDEPRAFP